MIRLLETLQGARRAWSGPILRLLDGDAARYVVGMTGSGIVSAIGNDAAAVGTVDGSIEVLELMAGGSNALHSAITGALAKYDAEAARCPFQKPPFPKSSSPCKVCGASQSETCRVDAVAAFQLVIDVRQALNGTQGS